MGDELEFTPCKNWNPGDTTSHVIEGKVLILRVGKWRMKIVRIVSDKEFESMGLSAPGWPIVREEKKENEGGRKKAEKVEGEIAGVKEELVRKEAMV